MSELPGGWTRFALKDLDGLSGGKTPSKANTEFWSSRDVPWVSPKDMKKSFLEDAEDRISQIAVDEAGMTLYPSGSVLIVTRSGILQHTFPVALTGVDLTVNQDIKVLRPVEGIVPKFSFYMLKSFGAEILTACSKDGTTVQSIESEKLEAFQFPLPPLAEQTRIAQKLDELLAQVDTLKARIDAIPALLKRFRQSTLAAAVSGRLTADWRAEQIGLINEGKTPDISASVSEYIQHEIDIGDTNLTVEFPMSWPVKQLKEICQVISGFAFSSSDFIEKGVPAVKISNIQYGAFEEKNQEYLPNDFLEVHDRYLVNPDDLLMALTRPVTNSTLKICKYPKGAPTALLNQRVCKFKFRESKIRNFSEWLFQSGYFKSQVIGHLSQTLQPNLSPKDLSNFLVGIPTTPEQTEIVRRVEQLFAFADQLEARVVAAKSRIDHLTQSILAKAFRGELVPQDPNDEPASVLLERIKAQRAAAPKAKRGRKPMSKI